MKLSSPRHVTSTVIVHLFLLSLTACGVAPPLHPPATLGNPEAHAPRPADRRIAESETPTPRCESVAQTDERGACYSHSPSSGKRGGGMCQPQCIPYARCRTQSSTCRLGNTSPVQWFRCEEKRGATSTVPKAGALMAVDSNHAHNMPTGHTLYVEEVCPNPDGTYRLRVSHTNYDRRCHLEEDAWVVYDPRAMRADFTSGHWVRWAKGLKVQGFILPE